ncbi:transcriptional regulator, AraC family (plasmid) [Fibrella aestuarina BUZ 2]|uniref:Transcriptional regulator, AraC family n=1 Tax=Fibrella aestuarina BUZ 2 TaxID=1166018 RepID=I0KHI9_9BACT|nr:AraC family transcriptional regulator [Fibrella aestuarina]CCH03592.1 transcriptional regulator, AraC family [Fibrella aestuarina BUZ 2]
MAEQTIHIKNMVCDRCIRAVQRELEQQGYAVRHIELGKATVEREQIDLPGIEALLEEQGFGLLTDRNLRLVNQVKTLIIDLIGKGDVATMNVTLSNYLAEQVGMEYAYLSHLFSTIEHLTIEKFWILQRVEKAKEWLSYDELSISEIARRLGYSSVAYLTNQFRQITGLTPAAYRKQAASDRNPLDWI